MYLYKKDEIQISTIEEFDKEKVLQYFSENTFNCDCETGSLRPTNSQFIQIMNDIISGKDDENNILVLKKDNEVIGYESIYVEYDRLVIDHIAVDKEERSKGYGELLTRVAILIAENEDRYITLYCNHKNKYLEKLHFKSNDGIHYTYKNKGLKIEEFPKLFITIDEYKKREEQKRKVKVEQFRQFLEYSKKIGLNI